MSSPTPTLSYPLALLAQTTLPVTRPAEGLVERLGLQKTWEQTLWWHRLALLGAIFFGVLAGRVITGVLKRIGARLEKGGTSAAATVVRSGAAPASLLVLTLALSTGLGFVAMDGGARDVVRRALTFLYVLSVGWFLFNLVDLIDLWFRALSAKTRSTLDDQLAPLIRKTLRVFLVVLVGLYIAQNVFDQDITAWLAGLGIAGLAVSLAAQESIKNLFGSITVFLDKPFAVGDRIVFDGFDGKVEEIGFRSTRIRLLNGELATVPNSKFIDTSVRNVSRRPSIPKVIELPISADLPPATVRAAVDALRALLEDPAIAAPMLAAGAPGRVYFDELRGDVRVIRVSYAFAPATDWWAYNEHLQALQLRILEVLAREGAAFAGVRTTIVGDPGQPVRVVTQHDDPA